MVEHWLLHCTGTSELRQRIFGHTRIDLGVLGSDPDRVLELARKTFF